MNVKLGWETNNAISLFLYIDYLSEKLCFILVHQWESNPMHVIHGQPSITESENMQISVGSV